MITNLKLSTALATAALALSAWAGLAGSASAAVTGCNNETPIFQGGDELSVDLGPGLLFAGIDIGGLQGTDSMNLACLHSDELGIDLLVTLDEDSPVSATFAGCLIHVGGCTVSGIKVFLGDGGAILAVTITGLTPDPLTVTVPPEPCIGIGATCP